jgi:uncharacterized protein
MDWIYYIALLVVLVFGLFVNILGLPGLWVMVAGYVVYAWVTGWNVYVGWKSLIAIFVLAVLAELVEFFAGAAGSKAAGGRKRGMIGAIVGGFLGAIFLSVIPIPIVAQVIGACLGAFLGAAVMEYSDRDAAHSLRVGIGAAKGRFVGIVSKLGFGIAMFIVALVAGFPVSSTPANIRVGRGFMPATTQQSTPATMPLTLPATTTAPVLP